MHFKDYIKNTCRESSIHGIAYFVKSELHWAERLFWAVAMISATYFSINICFNQWERFRDNPIVYAYELTWGKRDFPYAGITLCSNFYNKNDQEAVIKDLWHITPNDTKYQYYWDFLTVVNVLRYDTLHSLEPFENDTTLEKFEYVKALLAIRKQILPSRFKVNPNATAIATENAPSYDIESRKQLYAAAITEAGLCRTTSQLTEYTNPYGELKPLEVSDVIYCGFLNECNTKLFPQVSDDTKLLIYLHNVNDIVAPNHRSTILREATPDGSLTIELMLGWTTAESEVRNLPIAYRKCRYSDENELKYFRLYRPGLCRIECRINTALDMCNCKPYFYAAAPNAPICDIRGMLCLARKNWSDTQCHCVPLCEEITYTGLASTEQRDGSSKFERTIIVKLFLPRMALKRRVVFSTDQLIVSFGGAIGLFLGASFISIYGLLYLFSDYVFVNCKACCKRWRHARHSTQVRIVKEV